MRTMFEFYNYCEWLVKYSWSCITCWLQEWLLDWEGGPPYLYWWIKDQVDKWIRKKDS